MMMMIIIRVVVFIILGSTLTTFAVGSGTFQIPFGLAPEVQLEIGNPSTYTRSDNPVTNDIRFAIHLLDNIASQGNDNIVLSPFSILMVVAALAEGANGTTASELLTVLNRSESDLNVQRARTRQILLRMNQPTNNFALSVANALYIQKDFKVLPNFLSVMQDTYKMGMAALDFAQSESATNIINGWIDQATNHTIPDMIPPGLLDSSTKLVLVNAIHFNSNWKIPFDVRLTEDSKFFVSKDEVVSVATMSCEYRFPYGNFSQYGFEMMELPYKGDDVSMFVILPNEDQDVQTVLRRLVMHPFLLSDPSRSLNIDEGMFTVFLPKFQIKKKVLLVPTLMRMGANDVFNPNRADLSGITGDHSLYVSDALHEAMIEVNEKGTKAGAATSMILGKTASGHFNVNRPFLFLIRHNPTASVLFLGRVTHPHYQTSNSEDDNEPFPSE